MPTIDALFFPGYKVSEPEDKGDTYNIHLEPLERPEMCLNCHRFDTKLISQKGSIIEETVNFNRAQDCGCGINVAPLSWVRNHYKGETWKVLIRWEWLCGVCAPYMSDGKIRCEKVELVEIV